MAFIYCIINKINHKKYVGKTTSSVEKRFNEHLNDSNRKRCEKRPLYSAIRKYGKENFVIEILEECSREILSDKEAYWIDKLGTYKNGYNATKGGEGKLLIDDEEVIEKYVLCGRVSLVAREMNRDAGQISKILKEHNIYPEHRPYDSGVIKQKKKILQYNKEGVLVNAFDSVSEAANFLCENGYVKKQQIRCTRTYL